ncbi:hypothetical protein KJA16_02620 [Patescibacteria group bacterium]|nr:hypothetical protein [Patescibacteria group bacterium]
MPKIIKKHGKIALILALILVLVVMYFGIPAGQAAIDNREVKLSDSRDDAPSTSVKYDFEGDTSGTVKCIKMQFCQEADTGGSCTLPTGLVTTSAAIYDTAPFTWSTFTSTNWTPDVATNGTIELEYATGEAGGSDSSWVMGSITNPTTASTTSYVWLNTYSDSCSTVIDSGVVAFRIIEGVAVQATVAESLSVTISTVAAGSCTGDTGTTTVKSTTSANAVDFETLTADEFNVACHDIEVTTNAVGGYSLTSQETTSLKKNSDLIDDTVCGASACDQTTAQTWTDADTYPGFGHSCEHVTGTPCNTAYDWAASKKYRQFACVGADADCDPGSGAETAVMLMIDADEGTTKGKVHYKVGITGTEIAGVYSNEVVYIATPTY